MKTILRLTFLSVAVLAVNVAFSQNALEKKNIKKAEPATSVKTQSRAAEKKAGKAVNVSATPELKEANTLDQQQNQPTLKQTNPASVKTPAQMAGKPLKKQIIYKEKEAAEPKGLK